METNAEIKKLLKQIKRAPNKKAANALVKIYYREVLGYVYNRTHDKEVAMDITQEIFVGMLRSIANFDEKKSTLRTWIYQIASRRIADYYRSGHYQKSLVTDREAGVSEQKVEIAYEKKVEIKEISDFVDRLEPLKREIFRLKVFEDCTFDKIGEMLDLPVATVKTKFYATQKLIRKEFGEGGR